MEAINNPEDESMGSRRVKFSRELWIERDDFMKTHPVNTSVLRRETKYA